MKASISIAKSVGKNGANLSKDVIVIQKRLNEWIAANKLPGLAPLVTDGKSGTKTRQAIGAFQIRYLCFSKPDCRIDPGGQTVTILAMDYSQGSKPIGDPVVYNGWMNTPKDNSQEPPMWEKRGMFWYGVGAKAGAGNIMLGGSGVDIASAKLWNLKDEANNFSISAVTERRFGFGGGVSAGFVLCFATGMYYPNEFNRIETTGLDWGFSIGAKWLSFAGWVAKSPKLGKLVPAIVAAKYANGDALSEIAFIVKNGLGALGLSQDDTAPGFVTIDLPFGKGIEATIYYGVTKYKVWSVNLV